MSQVTPEKKMCFLEDLGGTVQISFIFGAGRAPCHMAITISSLSYCINNGERHLHPPAGAHVVGSVTSTGHTHLSKWSREVYTGHPG